MSSTATASGKVILLGEHAVVYGVPALAAGIERGARAEAERLPDGPSRLRLGGSELHATTTGEDLACAFGRLLAEGDPLPALAVSASIELPPGAGLGASAALGVAIARAALVAAGRPASDADAIARATAWERVFHGNPSGVDVTAAAIGGCFRFTRRPRPGASTEVATARADLYPLGARPIAPGRELVLCIGLTGISTSTRDMVEGLALLRAGDTERVDRSIAAIGALVDEAAAAVEAGDLPALGGLMDRNQALLEGLQLSTAMLEDLCARARRAGALGAKLTGKGGGGSVLALAADVARADEVLAAWRAAGYQGFVTRVTGKTPS